MAIMILFLWPIVIPIDLNAFSFKALSWENLTEILWLINFSLRYWTLTIWWLPVDSTLNLYKKGIEKLMLQELETKGVLLQTETLTIHSVTDWLSLLERYQNRLPKRKSSFLEPQPQSQTTPHRCTSQLSRTEIKWRGCPAACPSDVRDLI